MQRPEVLIGKSEIARRVAELGAEISTEYAGRPLTVVAMMNGALLFAADLVREIALPLRIDCFAASSYLHDSSSGELLIRSRPKLPVRGRHVLLVDDILDTGLTVRECRKYFESAGAESVRVCVLLEKKLAAAQYSFADWKGFDIPDRYVVGYGLDSEEEYRNLPYIGVLSGK